MYKRQEHEIAAAHNIEVASNTDQALANKTAIKVATMFDTMEQMRPQLMKEAEKERQKREVILAKQKAFAEKAAKEDRKAEKKPKKKSGGHRGFWSFLGFHKKKK